MKAQKYWWMLVCLTACSVFAQTNGLNDSVTKNTVHDAIAFDPAIFPRGKEAIWQWLIPPITFGITWLIGKIPPLHKDILPWLTPLVGIGLGWLLDWAGKAELSWWSAASAGAISVTIYEAVRGLTKADSSSALTPTPQTGKDS